jgi:hypothetical protein
MLHVFPLQLLHHFRLVLTLLHLQISIVLIRYLLSLFLIHLILMSKLLKALFNLRFLLGLSHYLVETHGQRVLLQVLIIDLLLPHLSLPDLRQVCRLVLCT